MDFVKLLLFAIGLCLPLASELHRSVSAVALKPLHGIGISLLAGAVQAALALGGIYLGSILKQGATGNAETLGIGLLVLVAIKMLIPLLAKKERPLYDISDWGTLISLLFALGINTLLGATGIGMMEETATKVAVIACVLFGGCGFFFSETGIILGRQGISIRHNTFMTASLLLFLAAIMWHVAF